ENPTGSPQGDHRHGSQTVLSILSAAHQGPEICRPRCPILRIPLSRTADPLSHQAGATTWLAGPFPCAQSRMNASSWFLESGFPPFGWSLAPETRRELDTFARIKSARQAKADVRLVFPTRKLAWLRFSSDPLH